MTFKSVEEVKKEWISKINVYSKFAFMVTFFCGLLTHGFMLLNKIPFYDDIGLLFHTGGTYKNGRWFLGILGAVAYRTLGGNYSMPVVNGLIAIVFIALSCGVLISIFRIENKISIFLIGCIMAAYPVVTVIFAYMFMAPCFTIALFLGMLAVYFTVRKKYGFVFGIICICLSLGLYQAYFAIPCVVFLVVLICDLFAGKEFAAVFKTALKYLFTLGAGMVVYFIVNKIFLAVKEVELTQYQGISDMGKLTVTDIIVRIATTYRKFLSLLVEDFQGLNASFLMKGLFGLSILLSVVIVAMNMVKIKNVLSKALLILFVVLLPLAINIIYVMCDENTVYIHGLMVYSSVFVLLIPIILLYSYRKHYNGNKGVGVNIALEWVSVLCSLGVIIYYIAFDNVAYLQADLLQSQVDTYCTAFISGIKNAEGYADEYPIILVQDEQREERYDFHDNSMYLMPQFSQLKLTSYDTTMVSWINKYSWPEYLMYRCGFNTENMKDYGELLENGEIEELDFIEEMPCYPDDGSIRVVDEKIVVKLSEY